MAQYKIVEKILEIRQIIVDAEDEDQAYDKASDIDYQDWKLLDTEPHSSEIEEV